MNRSHRYLIVNADDFGACRGVNEGVGDAHHAGVLTSASLMVTTPGTAHAVALARTMPRLSVGIHVDLTGEDEPARVDLDDPAAVERELGRQLIVFDDLLGRRPSHLDVHHNLHRYPTLTPVFAAAARRLDIPLREHSPVDYFSAFYGQWDEESHPEQISFEHLCHMLGHEIVAPITELSCHPGRSDPTFRSSYLEERTIELETLCDPRLPGAIAELGFELVNYDDLDRIVGGPR